MIKKTFALAIVVLFIFAKPSFSQPRTFTGKPIYQILTKQNGANLGTITTELFPNIAINHVKNFDSLVTAKFYDSTAFHRVVPGFVIQGGDPNSRHGPRSTWGYGDPSQPTVNAEFSAAKHLRGTLSAARDANINSANSQFFICVAPAPSLNGQYSIYGQVTAGMNVVDLIVKSPRDNTDNPLQKIEMFITYIGSNDSVPIAPVLNAPVSGTQGVGFNKQLKWNAVGDAIIYHLAISTDSLFATSFQSIDVGTTAYFVSGLQAATTYYWRVRANNGGHFSAYSQIWNFTTASAAGIEAYTNTNTKIVVAPNPCDGQFMISNVERENTVQVYDMTGRLVYQGTVKNNNCNIDLRSAEKGMYFYRVVDPQGEAHQGKIVFQ